MEDSRIESWKGIAAYFGRDERTVKRWEKTRGLPVHRLPGEKGGVFAYTRELEVWLNSASPEFSDPVAPGAPQLGRRATDAPVSLTSAAEMDSQVLEEPLAESAAAPDQPPVFAVPAQPVEAVAPEAAAKPQRRRRVVLFSAVVATLLLGVGLAKYMDAHHASGAQGTGPERVRSAAKPVDPAAQEAYLKGRYYWNHRTDGSLRQAVEAFTQAVVRDPNYAPAYAGLADSYNLMPQFSPMPKSKAFPLALDAARKAVALDDSLPEAHRALAFALFYWEWDVPDAFREFQRAIELEPKDVDAHSWYANALMLAEQNQSAVAEAEKARELDPTSRVVLANQALILYYSTGEPAGSVAKLTELEREEPDFLSPPQYLAKIYFNEHNYPAYIAETKRVAAISHDAARAALAEAAERGWTHGGERGLLQQMRDFYLRDYEAGRSSGYDLAYMCALLGQKPEADKYLEAAVEAHDYEAMAVFNGQFNAHMAGDAGFEQIKQKIKLRMNGTQGPAPGR